MNIKSISAIGLACCSLLGGSIYASGVATKNDSSKSQTTITVPSATPDSSKDKNSSVLPKDHVLKPNTINIVKKYKEFYVVLSENASTGYTWSYKTNGDSIQLISDKIIPSQKARKFDEPIVGAPSLRVWTFKATQIGTYKLQFTYARSWEKNTPPAKTVTYTVAVHR